MADFLSLFQGGPVNGQALFVKSGPDGPFDRPARWQQFERPITDRFGVSTGRVGIFLYELTDLEPELSYLVWTYRYVQYGEATVEVPSSPDVAV